jgi:hypothetical protein
MENEDSERQTMGTILASEFMPRMKNSWRESGERVTGSSRAGFLRGGAAHSRRDREMAVEFDCDSFNASSERIESRVSYWPLE